MNETHAKGFSWQTGYGAFTLGVSQKPHTINYIKRQAEHHRKRSFEEGFPAFLKKHAIDYTKYMWG
jgi:putative transposase